MGDIPTFALIARTVREIYIFSKKRKVIKENTSINQLEK